MTKGYKKLKAWYENKSGTKITDDEANEALQNLVDFFEILARWGVKRQGDSNPKPKAKQADTD